MEAGKGAGAEGEWGSERAEVGRELGLGKGPEVG